MSRSILHCDMNNFYASVECMLNPSLKKHPIAVCGSVEERHGIVLAKNYKAKAFDVKTGDAVWQAKQKCKDLVVVPPNFEEYIKYSKLARSIYGRYTNQVEPYGMDECWLDISGTEHIFGSAERVANSIRETIKFELGLTISVGVSFNKIFAKLGSDMKKPDAVTMIEKDTYREKVWQLPVSDLLGVGRATQRGLDNWAIHTIGDLAKTDPEILRRQFGKNGVALWNFANGYDTSIVCCQNFVSPIKSVGHGITTVEDLENSGQVWPVFLDLTQDIGHKLRIHNKCAEGVAIHIRDNTLFSKQWQCKLGFPTQSPMVIATAAFDLFQKQYNWSNAIRSVTVQAINLSPQDSPFQIDLFTDTTNLEKMERLENCIEEIRERYGKDSIRNAILCQNIKMPPAKAEITMPTGMIS
jgi:DNA polymerase-4